MKVRYSRRALNQLDDIYEYIERDSLNAAHAQRNLIRTALHRLKRSPRLGKLTNATNVYKLVLGKGTYVAYYSIIEDAIFVLRILLARQSQ